MKQLYLSLLGLLVCTLTPLSAQETAFTRITDNSNPVVVFANTPARYKGLAWIDFDHDNRPDLFMSQRFLFHNDGGGQFTQLPALAGAQGGQSAAGSSWGDIDNDGDPDAITASGSSALHLNGGAIFSVGTNDVPGLSGFPAWDCTLADADNNGWLDLLFVHAEGFHNAGPFPAKFYLQTAPGVFTPQSGYEFTDENDPYTVPIWTDYDLDGDLDLFIGSGPGGSPGPDYRYRNLLVETGTFGLQRLTAPPFNLQEDGQVYNFIDYDNDGDMDGMLTNYAGAVSRFWKNENGTLTPLSTPFTQSANGYLANAWGDVDNDGYQDVLISIDGHHQVYLFRNDKNGGLQPGEFAGITDSTACGIALADYDNDGDLDFAVNGYAESRSLFRNDELAEGRHWIAFTLTGTVSNRSAIGAKIRVKATIGGQSLWQIREILDHNSFQSQNDLRQHFGLDQATTIDSVEVRWPSGLVQQFGTQQADRFYSITEGEPLEVISAVSGPGNSIRMARIYPNPTSGVFRLLLNDAQTSVDEVVITDNQGRTIQAKMLVSSSKEYEIKLPGNTPSGTYWVQIKYKSGQSQSELLIKH